MQTIVTIVVIALAALIVLGVIAALAKRKRRQTRSVKADQVRREVVTGTQQRVDERRADAHAREAEAARRQAEAQEQQARAEKQQAQANRARLEADRARSELAEEQAAQQDQVREADRLDPDVNHRAKDYSPDTSAAPSQGPFTDTEAPAAHRDDAPRGDEPPPRA